MAKSKPLNHLNEPDVPEHHLPTAKNLCVPTPVIPHNVNMDMSTTIDPTASPKSAVSSILPASLSSPAPVTSCQEPGSKDVGQELLGKFSNHELIDKVLTRSGNASYTDIWDVILSSGELELSICFQ